MGRVFEGTQVVVDEERGMAMFARDPFASTSAQSGRRTILPLKQLGIIPLDDGALMLAKEEGGSKSWIGVVSRIDTSSRINVQDLPGYYQGFLTEDRKDAAELDNLTPNIKLALSASALLLAAVGLLILANPPPPSDQPLPTVQSRTQKSTPPPPTAQALEDE
eukprot:Tamp_22387.p2 GENE.Tamp_22387~~Tamp_22387.p2  ORF type:complete len:163 (-),score=20.31 Tamp_22387:152-640(-)